MDGAGGESGGCGGVGGCGGDSGGCGGASGDGGGGASGTNRWHSAQPKQCRNSAHLNDHDEGFGTHQARQIGGGSGGGSGIGGGATGSGGGGGRNGGNGGNERPIELSVADAALVRCDGEREAMLTSRMKTTAQQPAAVKRRCCCLHSRSVASASAWGSSSIPKRRRLLESHRGRTPNRAVPSVFSLETGAGARGSDGPNSAASISMLRRRLSHTLPRSSRVHVCVRIRYATAT